MRIHFVCCIDIVSTNYKDFVTNNISATTLPPSWWGRGRVKPPPKNPTSRLHIGLLGHAFTPLKYRQAQHPYLKIPRYGPGRQCGQGFRKSGSCS